MHGSGTRKTRRITSTLRHTGRVQVQPLWKHHIHLQYRCSWLSGKPAQLSKRKVFRGESPGITGWQRRSGLRQKPGGSRYSRKPTPFMDIQTRLPPSAYLTELRIVISVARLKRWVLRLPEARTI